MSRKKLGLSDVRNGWKVTGNLHNHSFFIDSIYHGDRFHPQGVLAPSANDMRVFLSQKEELGLQNASITNGFYTVDIQSSDFQRFHTAEN